MIPTRWRTLFEDQLADAGLRIEQAAAQLEAGEGSRALQSAYQSVVAAATVRVWLDAPPWQQAVPASELQRQATAAFPTRFAALATLDITDALTSAWTAQAARPYVDEARGFVEQTTERLTTWLAQG